MNMKNIYIPFLVFFLYSSNSFSCSCYNLGNFFDIIKYSDVVALVKVKKYNNFFELSGANPPDTIFQPLSATFSVIETIKGAKLKDQIEVYGDDGAQCSPYIDTFKIGKYYIIAFNKIEDNTPNSIQEYTVSICGEFWINYNNSNESVEGRIYSKEKEIHSITYSELKKELLDKNCR